MNHTCPEPSTVWVSLPPLADSGPLTYQLASLPVSSLEKEEDNKREGQCADGALKTSPTQEVTDSSLQAGCDPSAPS